jgi:hypothetical protein
MQGRTCVFFFAYADKTEMKISAGQVKSNAVWMSEVSPITVVRRRPLHQVPTVQHSVFAHKNLDNIKIIVTASLCLPYIASVRAVVVS